MSIKPYTTILIHVTESCDTLLQLNRRTQNTAFRNALMVLYLVAKW